MQNVPIDFDYLFILDFEAQCDNNTKLDCQEIIEFPVVVIDVKNQTINSKIFHSYVRPTIYPKLFPFCTELTGITQDQVDKGKELAQVLVDFEAFVINDFSDSKFTFVTCGDWDLKTCLKNEALYKNIELKTYFEQWINIKRVFADFIKSKHRSSMVEMLSYLDLPLVGRHHSGIDDAKNIAEIALKILKGGHDFSSKYLTKKRTFNK
jgi:inhibitor of KinA sporulation pathway (predicted exonuclease)